jgi:miniconductance mechanosensitive channel
VLFLIVLVVVDLSIAQLNGFNKVYQARPTYNGASIAAYIDIIKVLIFVGTIFLTLVIFTDSSPVAPLAGLVLIFRDTILNFLASIQLSTQELIKDGDWTEVPSLGVEGVVSDVTLSVIKVRNFDNTISAVPIYKLVEVPYKNYRGMEAWGRRIKRAVHIGLNSVRFCDEEMAVVRS